ncbi:MAG: IS200/IS605 family element transposase accessory protein TnpB [Roseiflexaceae bacterium]|nr:IS200/IS605 family element transposase accessory protein TnpB [Roseiflexaceae bacterium]
MAQRFSTRTVCVKVALDTAAAAALCATQVAFNQAASYCATVAWEQGIVNKNKLHHVVYGPTRVQFGLGAQLACCARDKAAEAVSAAKSNKSSTCPCFAADSSVRYDAHTYRLMSLDRVSLNTIRGRVIGQLVPGDFQRRTLSDPSWNIGGAELVRRQGVWYLHITQSQAASKPDEPRGVLGVDLGIVNIATDSDGTQYSGVQVRLVRDKCYQHRRRLQLANTRRSRWRLRQIANREHRFQKHVNHEVSKQLVGKASTARKALALEDLKHIRKRTDKTVRHGQRRTRSSWAFAQLRQFVAYKAVQAGVCMVYIDPRNTSRTCSACGHCEQANRQNQASFLCRRCGYRAHADANAAINISCVGAVNLPNVLRLSN